MKWISVKDKLPPILENGECSESVLVFCHPSYCRGSIYMAQRYEFEENKEDWDWFISQEYDDPYILEDITFWMPLPHPPSGNK